MTKNVYSSSKLAFHKPKIEALARGEITAPIYVRIKPTNHCNHRCFFCGCDPEFDYFRNQEINKADQLPKEIIMNVLSDFRDMGVKAVTYSGGGEPLTYPYILETIATTLTYGLDLSMITNGQLLKGERADILASAEWIRVSVDACDEETFSKSRRIPKMFFSELIKNIENFAKRKDTNCELGINFVVHKLNNNQIYNTAKFFKDLGVNHIKITPVYTTNFQEYHTPFKEEILAQIEEAKSLNTDNFKVYETYSIDFSLSSVSQRNYSRCSIMQIVPAIGADGFVYFCQDKAYSKEDSIGSLYDKSFKELWFSEKTIEIFRNFDPRSRCSHHCTYDTRNIAIQTILKDIDNLEQYIPDDNRHKNFI